MMDIALHVHSWDVAAIIERCQQLGVRQICPTLACLPGFAETHVPDGVALRTAVSALANAGITVHVANGSSGRDPSLLLDPATSRAARCAQLRTLEILNEAGIGTLLYYLHFPHPADPQEATRYWSGLERWIVELVTQAEATNVRLAHHAIWRCLPGHLGERAAAAGVTLDGYHAYRAGGWDGPYLAATAEDLGRIIAMAPSRHNGICFCTGMQIMGGDLSRLVRIFSGKIAHAQIRDIRGIWPGATEVPLGTGEINIRSILHALAMAEYRGAIEAEHFGPPRWQGDDREATAVAFLQHQLAEIEHGWSW